MPPTPSDQHPLDAPSRPPARDVRWHTAARLLLVESAVADIEVRLRQLETADRPHKAADPAEYLSRPMSEAERELMEACLMHPPMNTPHEGWSVIFEELEELREHIRTDTGRSIEARREAIQVAAMALRYVIDL